jgi:hypothetical protein
MDSHLSTRILHATVPFKEMFGYVNRLRGLTRAAPRALRSSTTTPRSRPGGDLNPTHPGAAIGPRIA